MLTTRCPLPPSPIRLHTRQHTSPASPADGGSGGCSGGGTGRGHVGRTRQVPAAARPRPGLLLAGLGLGLSLLALAPGVQAQATVKEDGQWRAALGLGFSASSGNTKSSSLTVNGEAVRASDFNKWSIYGKGLYAKNNGNTTGEQGRLGTRYDWNLSPRVFSFAGAEAERDRIAGLNGRLSANGGLGYKLVKTEDTTFNLIGGLGYTSDTYSRPRWVGGANRDDYAYANGVLGEESTHRINDAVSARQRLTLLPNLSRSGDLRAEFDAGLSVAMTQALSLNVGFSVRHNSDPGLNLKKTDTLLTTGIGVKFE